VTKPSRARTSSSRSDGLASSKLMPSRRSWRQREGHAPISQMTRDVAQDRLERLGHRARATDAGVSLSRPRWPPDDGHAAQRDRDGYPSASPRRPGSREPPAGSGVPARCHLGAAGPWIRMYQPSPSGPTMRGPVTPPAGARR
jgi:hypothetical protein